MSQSLLYHAFGVREGYDYQKREYVEGRVEFYLRVEKGLLKCPECGRPAWRRGSRERRVRKLPIGLREVILVAEVAHCKCQHCGKTFAPPFARAYAHYTHTLALFVCALSRWMMLSEVAALTPLGHKR